MDNSKTIFPEKIYKHRFCAGDAEYVHIEGDIYEDTTCTHYGGKCRIRVKKVDDHYEFVETANNIAKDYVYFHMKSGEIVATLMSIKKLSEFLPRPEFLRTHRSFIVHMPEAPTVERSAFSSKTRLYLSPVTSRTMCKPISTYTPWARSGRSPVVISLMEGAKVKCEFGKIERK